MWFEEVYRIGKYRSLLCDWAHMLSQSDGPARRSVSVALSYCSVLSLVNSSCMTRQRSSQRVSKSS